MSNAPARTDFGRELAATTIRPGCDIVVAVAPEQGFPFPSAGFQPMSSFDPATVRKAVEEFTPRRPQKFRDLMPAKEVIMELRQKISPPESLSAPALKPMVLK